ncbi:adenylate/guanylate cyclase domain-containing protein [Patescibacteria group bacterium]|nr:MAG: adenylate/guanylate cyclase domain-containing protein [Patescibacteria group bacterium]
MPGMFNKRVYFRVLPAIFLAALLIFADRAGLLQSWDAKVTDALSVGQPPAGDILIVTIDNASIQKLGVWPWRRSIHAKIIEELTRLDARAIGYDVNFPEAQSEPEDAALERAIAASGRVVLPLEATLSLAGAPPVARDLLLPLPRFSKNARLGVANTPADPDSVLRRIPVKVKTEKGELKNAFFAEILAQAGYKNQTSGPFLIVDFAGPARTYPMVGASELLEGKVAAAAVAGKIVLVGATAPDLHDQLLTPTAKAEMMSGVEAQANAVASGRTGGLREEPFAARALLIILVILLSFYFPLLFRRIRSALIWLFIILVLLGAAALVLAEVKLLISVFYPVLALFLGAAASILLRLSKEKREKGQLRTTLSRYVSHQVVEYLIGHPEKLALGGEKREMTVLFSDLRGFTTLSEKMKPEQLVAVLNTYLTEMTAIIFVHEGVLDKYMGDAVMAFWNAPLDVPDHAENAAAAAIAMRDRLREMNATGAFPEGVELRLGVGVNSGPMVVGNMGGTERFDYTVMGDAVNLGSRLEGLNKEYGTEIIVSESTAAKLSSGILLRPLDLVAVKGKKEPVEIFEVVGRRDEAAPAMIQFAADFAAARSLYREKKFSEAKAAFEALGEKFPADFATKNYIERCVSFLAVPPPSDWNGVWVMMKK